MVLEWLIFSLVLISFFWLLLRYFYSSEFAMWIRSPFSNKVLTQFLYELNGRLSFFVVAAEILSFLSLSFFLIKASEYYHLQFLLGRPLDIISYFMGFSALLVFFKAVLLYFINYFFRVPEIINSHFIILHIYNGLLGLIILPFLFFIYFSPSIFLSFFLLVVISLVIVFFLLKLLALFTNSLGSSFSFFGILLYLCTLEIIPILVLLKAILLLTN